MIRATPTGVSAVIDAYGRIVPGKVLGEGAYGAIDAPLPRSAPRTIFDQGGAGALIVFIFASISAAVIDGRATLRRDSPASLAV
jgi:apolipoprotein N-acyltransferase